MNSTSDNTDLYNKGECQDFCPASEIQLRKRERLVHFYEQSGGIFVKEFKRSCPGQKIVRSELRTEETLWKCVQYLLNEVILDGRKSYRFKYDFIFDRLRAVRQELVIQNCSEEITAKILEPIIMFLSYSLYYLCEEDINSFDPKICNQHLQECLMKTLCCYDELDFQNKKELYSKDRRLMVESVYIISNLGETSTLNRALHLPHEIRSSTLLKTSFKLSIDFFTNNFYQVLWNVKKLPHILAAQASLKLPIIRWKLLQRFTVAFNHKILTVPFLWLEQLMLHENSTRFLSELEHFNVSSQDQIVKFDRNQFDWKKQPVKPTRLQIVDEKFNKINLPNLILLRNF